MKIAALVLSIIAIFGALFCMFVYALGSALICVDVCPSASVARPLLVRVALVTLGPGVALVLAAWILSLLHLRRQGRTVWLSVVAATPIVVCLAGVVTLWLVGGSLTPAAIPLPADVAPGDRQIDVNWLRATSDAIIPLIAWPIACLVAIIFTWRVRPPAAAPAHA